MTITDGKLIRQKVRYGVYDSHLYFDIDEVSLKYPDVRFPPDKIREVFMDGMLRKGIRAQDIKELSEFDKQMIRLYHHKK